MQSKIVLGTVQFGLDYGINNQKEKPSLEKVFEILNTAFDSGIRLLDTAEAYGNAQEVIGGFHRQFPNKKFKVITKLAKTTDLTTISTQVKSNLEKLHINYLDGYMLHNYWTLKENPSVFDELLKIKKNRLADKIGISLYENNEIKDVIDNYDFDFIQTPFNLLDNDNHRGKILLEAKNKNMEVHTRSAFLQGLFFKDLDSLPTYLTPLRQELRAIEKVSNSHGLTTEQLALGYVNSKKYIDRFLIGVDSVNQLKSNLTAFRNELSKNQVFEIEQINTEQVALLNPSNWK